MFKGTIWTARREIPCCCTCPSRIEHKVLLCRLQEALWSTLRTVIRRMVQLLVFAVADVFADAC